MSDENTYDVIIIGSGPAGLTAAIYTSRSRLKTLMIAGSLWGGQLMLTTEVENFPGFPEGIQGPDLMNKMQRQAERLGTEILFKEATDIDLFSNPFKVKVQDRLFEGQSIIIATGASARWLGLESETRLRGRGVSTCATCDAAFFKDKKTVVVGGGDTAIEEALVLTKFVQKVMVIHRRDKLRATKALQARAFENDKIRFLWDTVVQEILGKERVEGVHVKNVKSGEESRLSTDAVFIAIGHKPNTDLFKGKIALDDKGYIIVHNETRTSVEGVFAAGDAVDYHYRQAITAAGAGCKAALDVEKYLESQES
ncbi:MAG: thioredoxin-disulfide reductase [Candidatus Bathyarchaeota archaeon]|nr:MAG: thioredoxin-disulfide reductase [Candidatus Bathyarchaeota archaeon]